MTCPPCFDSESAASAIARTLHPNRVLVAGSGPAPIEAALRNRGIEAVASAALPEPQAGCFDLIICWNPDTAARFAPHTTRLLLAGGVPESLPRFADLDFWPDLAFDASFLAPNAVLLRKGRQDSLMEELSELRRRLSQLEADHARELREIREDLALVLSERVEAQGLAIDSVGDTTARLHNLLQEMLQSRIWRTLCAGGALLLKAAAAVRPFTGIFRHPSPVPENSRALDPAQAAYEHWICEFERRDDTLLRVKLRGFALHPLVSIVIPVYRPPAVSLERAVASVRAQTYPSWQLCLAHDGPVSDETARVLDRAVAGDPRICIARLPEHCGISEASNAALALAQGEYVGFLDQDDELAPDALLHVVEAINRRPGAGLLYSDEDKIDEHGRRYDPFFKPEWSPDLLLSENYLCHFLVARRELVEQEGLFRSEYDGSQDYDLILRLSERTEAIVHIPKVLYHWRAGEGSAARSRDAKPHATEAARRAIEGHLRRCGNAGTVEPGLRPGRLRVRYPVPGGSHVTIVIPSGGNVSTLRTCLETLRSKTAYPDYDVLVADNSRGDRIERLVRSFGGNGRPIRRLDLRRQPFNYSAINNAAVRECSAPLLLFLNDDTEVIEPQWLGAMVELGARPEVGAVGARLLYPDGRIQHAGVILGVFQNCGHAFRGFDGQARHYYDFPDVIRNVSAVTGACMLMRSSVFQESGGFDDVRFANSFNDVDLCLRIGRLGYRILYTPHALLYHHESLSRRGRGLLSDPSGVAAMRTLWKDVIAADPFYSPNLTRTEEDYSFRRRAGNESWLG